MDADITPDCNLLKIPFDEGILNFKKFKILRI